MRVDKTREQDIMLKAVVDSVFAIGQPRLERLEVTSRIMPSATALHYLLETGDSSCVYAAVSTVMGLLAELFVVSTLRYSTLIKAW